MTDERCLRVPYHAAGAAFGWFVGILMMGVATAKDSDSLRDWALVVIGAAMVWSVSYIVTQSRGRMLEAFDLRLRMRDQAGQEQIPRIPTMRS